MFLTESASFNIMNKTIQAIILLSVLFIGIFVGFTLMQDAHTTGASVVCTFNEKECECVEDKCFCGEFVIEKNLCLGDTR